MKIKIEHCQRVQVSAESLNAEDRSDWYKIGYSFHFRRLFIRIHGSFSVFLEQWARAVSQNNLITALNISWKPFLSRPFLCLCCSSFTSNFMTIQNTCTVSRIGFGAWPTNRTTISETMWITREAPERLMCRQSFETDPELLTGCRYGKASSPGGFWDFIAPNISCLAATVAEDLRLAIDAMLEGGIRLSSAVSRRVMLAIKRTSVSFGSPAPFQRRSTERHRLLVYSCVLSFVEGKLICFDSNQLRFTTFSVHFAFLFN